MATQRVRDAHRRGDIALRLHLAGATYAEIAQSTDPDTRGHLYNNPNSAYVAVDAAKKRNATTADPTDDALRDIEIARLDRLQRALWPAATGGDVAAVREIRQLVVARARLLGIDTVTNAPDKSKGDAVDELEARRAARHAGTAGL